MTRHKSLAINVLAAAATLACLGTASAQENTYNPNAYILLNGSVMKPDSKFPEDKVGYGGGVWATMVSSVRVVVVTGTGAAVGGAPKAQVRPTLTYVLAAFFWPSKSRWR